MTTPQSSDPVRARRATALAAVLALTLALCGVAEAAPANLIGSAGGSFAASGDPGGGGPTFSLSALWPFMPGLEFGVMAFAADVGNRTGVLRDPNDPSITLGATQEAERWSFGGAWRLDAAMRRSGWVPYASLTYGYYRVHRDRVGVAVRVQSATGASLGLGLRHEVASGGTLGLSVRYHQLSSDELEHYLQLTIDGSVRWGK